MERYNDSHNTNLSGGLVVLFSKSFTPVSCDVTEVVRGRCIIVTVQTENVTICIVNIYAPVGSERLLFLNTLNDALLSMIFFLGDFNCTEESL